MSRRLVGPRLSGWLLLLLAFILMMPASMPARADEPGDFDFYVLSLSWSPTYCQDRGRSDRIQCGERPYAFVVHGLWPQYEHGFPRNCPSSQSDVSRRLVNSMLDLMPSPSLVRHEWQVHGKCSGLDPARYFDLVRRARDGIDIPQPYVDVEDELTVSPREVEGAFIAANPGIGNAGISVTCDRRLREVRICMTRDLKFRACPEVDRDACRRSSVVMPPLR